MGAAGSVADAQVTTDQPVACVLDVLLEVFSFLPLPALSAVLATSRKAMAMVTSDDLWRDLFLRRWPVPPARDAARCRAPARPDSAALAVQAPH